MTHLLYLLINATGLLLLHAVIHAEELPDLTVIDDHENLYCVVRNDTSAIAFAGLARDTPAGRAPKWLNLNGDVPLCSFASCFKWKQNKFFKKAVNELHVKPLLNFYWEELELATEQYQKARSYEISSESWLLDVSILAENDVYFNISSASNISYYWVLLGGWQNNKTAIWIPQTHDNYLEVCSYMGRMLDKKMWLHFRLSWDKLTSQFQVMRWGYNDNKPFFKCSIISPKHIKIFNKLSYLFLRVHKYKVWSSSGGDASFESRNFTSKSERLCFIVTYNIQSVDSRLLVAVNSILVHILEKVGDSWQDERIEVNLDQVLPNWREVYLRISLRTTNEEGAIHIAGIHECNPQGDTRILQVKHSYYNKKELHCNFVQYNQSYALGDVQKKKDCRDTCTWTCKDYIPSLSTCKYAVICKSSNGGNTSCFCSPGYKGDDCRYKICAPIYENKGKCINLTVNSVTVSPPEITYKRCRGTDVVPVQYRLEYRVASDCMTPKWTFSGKLLNATNLTVEGLQSATTYEIRAVVGDEYGTLYVDSNIPSTFCTTTCTDPYVVAEPNETSIKLTLKKLDNYTCPFRYVMVCANQSSDIDINQPVFIVTNLRPFIPYDYLLKMGQKIIQQGTVKTTKGALGPPVGLNMKYVSSTNIRICWYNPHVRHNMLRDFIVQVQVLNTKLRKEIGASKDSHSINLPVKEAQPYACYMFKKLLPSTTYNISVCDLTAKHGRCESLQEETALAKPDITPGINLVHNSITSTSFDVSLPPAYPYLTKTSAYVLILTSEDDSQKLKKESDAASMSDFKKSLLEAAHLIAEQTWIIDELQLTEEGMKYTIGEGKETNGTLLRETFQNRPLQPGASYNVTLVLVNQDGKVNHYAISSMPAITTALHNDAISYPWLALLILIVLLPLAYFIYRWKKKHELKQSKTFQLAEGDLQTPAEEEVETYLEDSPTALQQGPSQKLSRRVAISELESYVKTGLASGEFLRQHSLLPSDQTKPCVYAKKPQNITKNRHGDLVAYDETRVKLKQLPNDELSDYINANYIDGYNSTKCYIATQGPKPNTVDDFWRMVWQEQVHVIAMLTNVMENGKRKCEQYWPELKNQKAFGSIFIHNICSKIFADYTFRELNVTHNGETRKVHHLHFTSWPSHGVPLYPQPLAEFLKKMLTTPREAGPIVVHCSAGVGRPGTIILADICMRMAAAEGCVDVLHYQQQIWELRTNLEEYKLVYLVLLECLVGKQHNLPFNSMLPSCVKSLHCSGKLHLQFKQLDLLWQDKALTAPNSEFLEHQAAANSHKNRFQYAIPGAKGRVFIRPCEFDDDNSDYINAVYVDGFKTKNQFIATQFPLRCTVQHFWRLIVMKNIGLVIVLNEVDLTDKTVCQFWPHEKGNMNPAPDITVTHHQQQDNTDWVLHTLSVTDLTTHGILKLLQVKGWAESNSLPPSPELLLKLCQEVEQLYIGNEPILVTCYDGTTACGLFLAQTFVIEKIKLEQECDPYHAARTVRQNRTCFITTLEQFCFLYEVAVNYLQSFQTYANAE